ncbi:MAG TPA: hypothetical protein VGL03_10180 [Thermoanaerobaculia bacterium]|jgi:hypothetical protein
MKRLLCSLAGFLFLGMLTASAQSGEAWGRAEVSSAARHDVSPPLRDIKPIPPRFGPPHEKPRPIPLGHVEGLAEGENDPALQSSANVLVGTTSPVTFDGLGVGGGYTPDAAPPDTNGAVGATQYVQWVNEAFAVYSKTTGARLYGPAAGNTIWTGFGGPCQSSNDGDPIAQYDKAANRWVMTQLAVSSTPYTQCLAVSTTSDATGSWNRYAFSYGTQFNDYPKLGVWPDAYYITYNIFTSTFQGSKLCALDRAKMLAGQAATQQCFQLSSSFGGVLPADLDSATAPPAGAPNYMLNFGNNSLNLWKFHVDWATPANTTLTGPTSIPVAAFTSACGGGACITQPSTSQKLDSLGDRLMYRLAYRNFGTYESLVVNHSVKVSGNRRNQVVGVRWYELRSPNATPTVYQQGTYSPDSNRRWMGSIAMDKVGDIALGYSVSSASLFPSIRYTGRVPTDPLGTMELESNLYDGTGSQLQNLNRWGDYSAMAIDPVDQCTFWYTTEYLKTSGTFNWSTRIGHFKFPGCQ